jgi:hypothetical protein
VNPFSSSPSPSPVCFLFLSCLVLYCIKLSRSATSSSSTSYQVIPSATIIRSLLVATTVLLEIAQSKQFSSLSISISILIPFFCSLLFCSLLFSLLSSLCLVVRLRLPPVTESFHRLSDHYCSPRNHAKQEEYHFVFQIRRQT